MKNLLWSGGEIPHIVGMVDTNGMFGFWELDAQVELILNAGEG